MPDLEQVATDCDSAIGAKIPIARGLPDLEQVASDCDRRALGYLMRLLPVFLRNPGFMTEVFVSGSRRFLMDNGRKLSGSLRFCSSR